MIAATLVLSVSIGQVENAFGDEPGNDIQIKKLVPVATAMSKVDFMKLAQSSSPRAGMVPAVSLSMELMKAPIDANSTEEMIKEFGFAKGTVPKPSKMAQEYIRPIEGSPDLVTAVHFDRITKQTVSISDGVAKGMITYSVPKLYSGQFNYEAKSEQGKWRIVRITMPARKVDLIRDEDGNWKNAANK